MGRKERKRGKKEYRRVCDERERRAEGREDRKNTGYRIGNVEGGEEGRKGRGG